ncbi:MAG: DUF192 domain-containing protein [bacterium]|nr:DUF192 domain-containing protein [bacterium]
MYKQVSIWIGLLVLAVCVVLWFFAATLDNPRAVVSPAPTNLPMTTVTIGTDSTSSPQATIQVEVASTPAQRQLGLSGRASLAAGKGMLFVFTQPNEHGFWMKDMHFSIDIIWADSAGVITTIAHDISPSTYPQAFYPNEPAFYVLEVPSGFAKAHDIAVGGKIMVSN